MLDLPGRVVLVPIDENPLQAAREAAGDAFARRSIEEIRSEAFETAKTEIDAEVRERGERKDASDSN